MSYLGNILATRPGPYDDYWYTPSNFSRGLAGGGVAYTGEPVNTDTALRVSAVYACVKVLAETLATLPLKIYRRIPGGKQEAPEHPLYELLHDQPNAWQTAFELIELMMGHCALTGNAIARVVPGPRGAVDSIEPLVGKIEVFQREDMRLQYEFTPDGGAKETLGPDQVLHVRNWSFDGLVGMSPIALAVDTIGRAIAQNKYAGSLYRDGTVPHGILTTEKKLGPDARRELAKEWEDGHRGAAKSGRVAVVDQGLDWKSTAMTAEDAQMIEAMKFSISDIARIFRVPPHLIADLDKATYSNIEQQDIGLTKHTMTPWCKRWTLAIRRDLIVEKQEYVAAFLLDGLQAGDIKTRYMAHKTALGGVPFETVNEVRRKENLNPVLGGDEVVLPLNVTRPSDRDRGDKPADDDDSDKAPDDEQPGGGDASAAIAVLAEDVAGRIARREVKALSARANKAAEDPARFATWAGVWFGGQIDAIFRTIEPVATAWLRLGGRLSDTEALAERIAAGGIKAVAGDPVAAMATWEDTRAREVTAAITEELKR
jgi:HK97 family phage portal protein